MSWKTVEKITLGWKKLIKLISKQVWKNLEPEISKLLSEQSEKLSAHTKQINDMLEILKDLHPRFWNLNGDVHRSMAFTFRDSPYTSFILWLRSSEAFNRSGNIDMARETLKESYNAIKQVKKVTVEDLNEVNKLMPNIDPDTFQHEIDAMNDEIARLTKS